MRERARCGGVLSTSGTIRQRREPRVRAHDVETPGFDFRFEDPQRGCFLPPALAQRNHSLNLLISFSPFCAAVCIDVYMAGSQCSGLRVHTVGHASLTIGSRIVVGARCQTCELPSSRHLRSTWLSGHSWYAKVWPRLPPER
ncbi:hypothetical protein PENSPDRAFT_657230 [Peniophora sp. CONT]|nr:hypothetical protein PENSPDRAFT_657230 [Peniophora sp. CONT]